MPPIMMPRGRTPPPVTTSPTAVDAVRWSSSSSAAGCALVFVVWRLVLPWHLDEIDEFGRRLTSSADENAGRIGLVFAFAAAVAFTLLFVTRKVPIATCFAVGASVSWAVLFAWRASVAQVSGANFFVIPLVGAICPLALALPVAILAVGRRLHDADGEGDRAEPTGL